MKSSKFRLVNIGRDKMRGATCYSDSPETTQIAVAVTKSYIYILMLSNNMTEVIWNPYEISADGKIYMKYLNEEFRDVYGKYPDFLRVLQDLVQHPNDKEPV